MEAAALTSSCLDRLPSFQYTIASSPALIANWSRPSLSAIQPYSPICEQRGACRVSHPALHKLQGPMHLPAGHAEVSGQPSDQMLIAVVATWWVQAHMDLPHP